LLTQFQFRDLPEETKLKLYCPRARARLKALLLILKKLRVCATHRPQKKRHGDEGGAEGAIEAAAAAAAGEGEGEGAGGGAGYSVMAGMAGLHSESWLEMKPTVALDDLTPSAARSRLGSRGRDEETGTVTSLVPVMHPSEPGQVLHCVLRRHFRLQSMTDVMRLWAALE
jgi:hypothetical protein